MDAFYIVFWVLVAAFFIAIFAFMAKVNPKQEGNSVVAQLTTDALFLAIILVMGFVPNLGYITIAPGVSLTLMHVPVLVGCYCFGWKRGWLYGLFFGVTSWISAMQNPIGFNGFFIYPWVSILPRVIFGFVAGILFSVLKKMGKIYRGRVGIGITGLILTLIHTVLVFADLFIFFPNEMVSIFKGTSTIGEGLVVAFAVAILIGALGEGIVGGLVSAVVGPVLSKLRRKK